MRKSEMQMKFKELLDRRKETMKRALDRDDKPGALMFVGEICGIAASMQTIGLIDYDQREHIEKEAWALYKGEEPEYEPC